MKTFLYVCVWFLSIGIIQAKPTKAKNLHAPVQGESVTYQIYYGFIRAGNISIAVDKALHQMQTSACYKLKIQGKSSTELSLIGLKLAYNWVGYLDKNSLHPHKIESSF